MRKFLFLNIVAILVVFAASAVRAEKEVFVSKNLSVNDSRLGQIGCLSASSYLFAADSWGRHNKDKQTYSGGYLSTFVHDRCSGYVILDSGVSLWFDDQALIVDKRLKKATLVYEGWIYDYYQGWVYIDVDMAWYQTADEVTKGNSFWVTRKPSEIVKSRFKGEARSANSIGVIIVNGIDFAAGDPDEDAYISKGNNVLTIIRR
ncbi:hypothetical protein HYW53_00425 [Candidatus Giovannonibacteria bacterium]|nr:hypothetical protein [Candidatus Giovannonibacteria bacterium]